MPVIVIGADTDLGWAIVDALLAEAAELRAYVTDAGKAELLKARGVKVAIGDVSDGIRVGDAAHQTFCAVCVGEAASDERERSFADSSAEVVAGWADGLSSAGTRRVIWVGDDAPELQALSDGAAEFAVVPTKDRQLSDIVAAVVDLEGAERLP